VTLLTPEQSAHGQATAADAQANRNWTANLAAIERTQPRVSQAIHDLRSDLTWLFARDGSLHAMDPATGQWFAGCSVPLLAGRAVLKSLEPAGNVASCFLAPAHAGLLRAARERIGHDPALLAIVPDLRTLGMILACHDFSIEIASHHLWFISGESWAAEMLRLFQEITGLPTPGRFIRTKLIADDVADAMIAESQNVFSAVLAERTRAMQSIRTSGATRNESRVLLIGGSTFRLWDDAAAVLADALTTPAAEAGLIVAPFDSDDPASSSPLALAMAAAECGRVVAANVSRADAVNLVAMETPWITWVTRTPIPPFAAAGPRDQLLVTDKIWRRLAIDAGWPSSRVTIGAWPAVALPSVAIRQPTLALIADTKRIEIPESLQELSSHRVLWENIAAELHDHPLAVDDANEYLDRRAARLDIAPDTLDRRRFLEGLILPAYQQGCARAMIHAGLPLRLHGLGWEEVDDLRAPSAGPVRSRAALLGAVAASVALVDPWPARHSHLIDTLGRTVISRCKGGIDGMIRDAKRALTGVIAPPTTPASPDLAQELLRVIAESRTPRTA
jgi:hypothetical protein